MADEKITCCCKDCFQFKKFKEKCWFYWENKKQCTQKVEEGEEKDFISPIENRLNQ